MLHYVANTSQVQARDKLYVYVPRITINIGLLYRVYR